MRVRTADPEFDHIVVGAGLSGLLLTRSLLEASPQPLRILLVDPRPAAGGPVTYAFWTQGSSPLDRWRIGSWRRLRVVGTDCRAHTLTLGDRVYTAVDWGRGRADLLEQVGADPRVTLLQDAVDAVDEDERAAVVRVAGRWRSSRWVYDSRPPLARTSGAHAGSGPLRAEALQQSFHGFWVRTAHDALDPDAATIMDFSIGAGRDLCFGYVLPCSTRSALVMAVTMGVGVDPPDPEPAVRRAVGAVPWQVTAQETGVSPLILPAPPRRLGQRVLAIGVKGGRLRPSTGYAVPRILADTAAIRESLQRHGHPFAIPRDPRWQPFLDRIWLTALARERAALAPAFVALFTGAPVDRVLRFLDGDAGLPDIAAVVRALPKRPFIRALVGEARPGRGGAGRAGRPREHRPGSR